ncbi:Tfp pilus assembly protein PilE [Elusimicrobium posterum]|uniref:prepilin-type N-terminal cleavage/methylation domain-containing protein n=1 Tax=Elusimicrobium posterum TaxID=3116653 RepID=UPI003C740A72
MFNFLSKKIFTLKNTKGFTMMELLVILILVALLATLAFSGYRTSIENSRRDQAAATLEDVATAAQRFYIDYPGRNFQEGVPLASTTGTGCSIQKYSATGERINPNLLISCGYLPNRKWDSLRYTYYVCGNKSKGAVECQNDSEGRRAVAFMRGTLGQDDGATYRYMEGVGMREWGT